MKNIRIFSIGLTLITVGIAFYAVDTSQISLSPKTTSIIENPTPDNVVIHNTEIENAARDIGQTIEKAIQDTGKTIEKAAHDTGHTLEKATQDIGLALEMAASDTVGDTEKNYFDREYASLYLEIMKQENKYKQNNHDVTQADNNIVLLAKLGFSLLFGLSALFIVLSQRYQEDTEKWAFSVLSLISGVWIGTIS